MAYKPQNSSQVVNRSALPISIGSSANATLASILGLIDAEMVTLTGTQSLTNKTIGVSNAGLLSNTLQFEEISTPSTNPAANTLAIYPKTDGHLYTLNSSGIEIQVGSSGSTPIGSIDSSMLTLTQYQGQAGTGWVLAEGQTVSGSTYENITGNSSLVISGNALATATGVSLTLSTINSETTANTIISTPNLTNIPSAGMSGIAIGQLVESGIAPIGTTVTSIGPYTFALPGTADQYTFAVHSSTQYIFTVTSANATMGAVYSNNSQSFTVDSTIAAGTTLDAAGTGAPTASGTLTLVSGTGDATITFSAFAYAGATAVSGATYTNNGHTYTVSTTVGDSMTLTAIGTGDPAASGTLTKVTGGGDATIIFTSFTFGAHNATAGATYTNNGHTYTVQATIDDATTLVCTGTGNPSTSGTLTLSSGTGDATIPFSSYTGSVVISANASATVTGAQVWFSTLATTITGNTTNGSTTISNLSTTVSVADGQLITGSGISSFNTISSISVTTVPDLRGVVLRGKDNGRGLDPSGDLPLGTYEGDTTAINGLNSSHAHTYSFGANGAPNNGNLTTQNNGGAITNQTFATSTNNALIGGDAETRGKSVVINHFIRIN